MTLYLTQFKSERHDLSMLKELYPGHAIVPVFEGSFSIADVHSLEQKAGTVLAHFNPSQDKIVLMGIGIAQALCVTDLILRFERVPALFWDAVKRRYVEKAFERKGFMADDLDWKPAQKRSLPEAARGGS